MDRLRFWIGKRLRYLADRIDDEHAFVMGPGYFNLVPGKGIVITKTDGGNMIRPSAPGTQLWYIRNQIKKAHKV